MKVKTNNLTGAALDWAVAMVQGLEPEDIYISGSSLFRRLRDEDGNLDGRYMTGPDLLFSRKWEAGGPIIERERIDLTTAWNTRGCGIRTGLKNWSAVHPKNHGGLIRHYGSGPNPLVAAMRCYVSSKLGDEVDIPDSLSQQDTK